MASALGKWRRRPVRAGGPLQGATAGKRGGVLRPRPGSSSCRDAARATIAARSRASSGVEVAYVSSAEIVGQLAAGAAHFGVAGEDLVREKVPDVEARLELLSPLGFGHANVVVAAPRAWIDVRTMADLDDVASAYRAKRGERMRVATKYVNLTRRFFAEHGVADYRIVESLGATEGAPASGAAELIVDITTTGATLAANALKALDDGVILRSQATLVASLTAPWGENARAAARDILARIAASEEARQSREVRARLPSPAHLIVETACERFGAVSATGEDVDPHGFVALHCARGKVAELAGWLLHERRGARQRRRARTGVRRPQRALRSAGEPDRPGAGLSRRPLRPLAGKEPAPASDIEQERR